MHLFEILPLIKTIGLIGIFLFIFAESGLFFGFFLPGDSLLFSAGFLASQDALNIFLLIPLMCIGAVLGDNVGYWFGAKVGPALFKREDSRLFRKEYLERTHIFYERHGVSAIVLARFVPIVRTFTPILAGIAAMSYRKFLAYNVIGGVLWGAGVTFAGYYLVEKFPIVERYLTPIILAIIITSLIPIIFEWIKSAKENIKP